MRLLLTTDTIGGVWSFTKTLVQGLLAAGDAVALVSFGREPTMSQQDALQALHDDFGSNFLFVSSTVPLEWMDENDPVWDEGSCVLLRVIEEFRAQVLHSSQMCFGRLSSRLPVVVTAHSDVLSWAECTLGPGGVDRLARTSSSTWLGTYQTLVARGLREASAVVAPTRWMAHTLTDHFDLPRLPHVVPNGAGGMRNTQPARKLQAITAGRFGDPGKGLSILRNIRIPIPLLIAGARPKATEEISGHFLGDLAHEDLLALFGECSIYVACSVYEPFGLAPLEAANQGCAIVARDLPTFREVWGDAALYFSSTDSLQRLLESLAGNPARLRGAQCRARQRATRYSAQAMTDRYRTLYEDLAHAATHEERTLAHA